MSAVASFNTAKSAILQTN